MEELQEPDAHFSWDILGFQETSAEVIPQGVECIACAETKLCIVAKPSIMKLKDWQFMGKFCMAASFDFTSCKVLVVNHHLPHSS